MAILVSDLVTRTEKRLHMVSGVGVQVYAEDLILHSIQTAFERLFLKRWWPHYSYWGTWALDGTTGKVTTDLTSLIKEHSDIYKLWYESDKKSLPRLPHTRNPADLTGTRARYWEPLSQEPMRVFRILPITTTGNVTARYRTMPDAFEVTDTIYLDPLLLELASALDYLVSDNANPVFIDAVQGMLQTHYNVVDNAMDDDEFELTRDREHIPEDWY